MSRIVLKRGRMQAPKSEPDKRRQFEARNGEPPTGNRRGPCDPRWPAPLAPAPRSDRSAQQLTAPAAAAGWPARPSRCRPAAGSGARQVGGLRREVGVDDPAARGGEVLGADLDVGDRVLEAALQGAERWRARVDRSAPSRPPSSPEPRSAADGDRRGWRCPSGRAPRRPSPMPSVVAASSGDRCQRAADRPGGVGRGERPRHPRDVC